MTSRYPTESAARSRQSSLASFRTARCPFTAPADAIALRASGFGLPSAFGLRHFGLPFALLLAGCAVGPNYHRPAALGTNAMPAALHRRTCPPTPASGSPPNPRRTCRAGSWWELFGDPELNRLEVLATTNNQQLAAAYANLQQARALVGVARSDFWPQISGDARRHPPADQRESIAGRGGLQPRLHLQPFSVPARRHVGTRPLGPRAPLGRERARQPRRLGR